jgi:hypothetical protein
MDRKEKTTPFGVNSLRSPVLYSVGHHTKFRAATAAESKESSVLTSLYLSVIMMGAS